MRDVIIHKNMLQRRQEKYCRKLSLASKIFNMFTGGGSHARLLRRQGAGLQDNVL